MDVVSHDDLMRLRTDHCPANMAIIRHTVLNLIRAIKDKASLKIGQKPSDGTMTISSAPLLRAGHEL